MPKCLTIDAQLSTCNGLLHTNTDRPKSMSGIGSTTDVLDPRM
jgi:hypothetical protein